MANDNSPIQKWWDQLSEQQRRDVLAAHTAGRMSDEIAGALSAAGIPVSDNEKKTHTFPRAVDAFLKMRH
jgi:hypothetical protein